MAVARQTEGFTTLKELIPGLAFHVGSMLLGTIFIGLGQKSKKSGAAGQKVVIQNAK